MANLFGIFVLLFLFGATGISAEHKIEKTDNWPHFVEVILNEIRIGKTAETVANQWRISAHSGELRGRGRQKKRWEDNITV